MDHAAGVSAHSVSPRGHRRDLLLDTDCECAVHAKVNPPIRPREDVEALWQAVLNRKIDWIVSDHACCSAEQKWSQSDPNNIWLAKSDSAARNISSPVW